MFEDEKRFIDLPNSPLWLAYEYPQVNPSEEILAREYSSLVKLFFCLRHPEKMTLEQAQLYWRTQHGPRIRGIAGGMRLRRYLQVHRFEDDLEGQLRTSRGTQWFLQYPLAFRAAGHSLLWLELLRSSGNRNQDLRALRFFYDRLERYDLAHDCVVLLFRDSLDSQPFEAAEVFGADAHRLARSIADADVLLNVACSIRQPLLSLFKRRALLDSDPGHLQVSALTWDLNIQDHEALMTIGARINAPNSIPTLGLQWQTFEPMVYLPAWQVKAAPGRDAPFTSITQWTWEELHYNHKVLSVSKRDAYLKYAKLPRLVNRAMELAANIGSSDPADDTRLLQGHGWRIVNPHRVAYSPETYREYLGASRGEFMCPKPIHVQLRTGWFSDRSLSYLAIGRPVIAEETGFSERTPTGTGLLSFTDIDAAAASIAEIDTNYERHHHAAREIVEGCFNWRNTVERILSACV